jgi:hypothetical protein
MGEYEMRRLAIDIDGVLANFNHVYTKIVIEESGKDLFPVGWKLNKNFPPVWEHPEYYGYTAEEVQKAWRRIESDMYFWESLPPIHESETRKEIKVLNNLAHSGHYIYFLTSRLGFMAKQQTERWLKKYGMDNPTVLIANHDKVSVVDGLDCDFVIEDNLDMANKMSQHLVGVEVYLYNAPYNRENFTHHRHPDLIEIDCLMQALLKEELI